MFPGLTTRLSEQTIALTTTIAPLNDLVRVTSTTSTTVLVTIVPPFGVGSSGIIFLSNHSGANITTVTTGNILTARTIPDQMPVYFIFSRLLNKWLVGPIS